MTTSTHARAVAAHHPDADERSTRRRVLRLVVEDGPISVADLAADLGLTAAGVRRHVACLVEGGEVAEHTVTQHGQPRRGRPARRFVATPRGQAVLSEAYADLATQALTYLADVAGPDAVRGFADARVAELEHRHRSAVVAAPDVAERVRVLADALAGDGYAASVRPLPGGRAVQLCQGHCPVQDAAAEFPELCEAETRLFSRVLGVHVQRLSTLASGGHVCTTHVPLPADDAPDQPAPRADQTTAPAATAEGTR